MGRRSIERLPGQPFSDALPMFVPNFCLRFEAYPPSLFNHAPNEVHVLSDPAASGESVTQRFGSGKQKCTWQPRHRGSRPDRCRENPQIQGGSCLFVPFDPVHAFSVVPAKDAGSRQSHAPVVKVLQKERNRIWMEHYVGIGEGYVWCRYVFDAFVASKPH